ncbi:MAG: hydroxysqualene dehydroxylase HpnE [Planctomycetota bacterium]
MTKHIVIVGGGLAGISAAEALSRNSSESRVDVTLIESRRQLGGRAGSFTDRKSGDSVDFCQHVAMGCCTNFLNLAHHLGIRDEFNRYDELLFLHPTGGASRFRGSRLLPPPFHLAGSFGRLKYLSGRQRIQIAKAVFRLMRCPDHRLTPRLAGDWLRANGQNESTIRDFWDVFLVSALGELTDRVSISTARKVIIDGFASHRRASDVWIPRKPLSDLFGQQAAAHLIANGVAIRTGCDAKRITPSGPRFELELNDSSIVPADGVILAVPWHALNRIRWQENHSLPIRNVQALADIPSSPITGLHLWFDHPIMDVPHAVLVGTTAQWVFCDPIEQRSADEHYVQVVISASHSSKIDSRDELLHTVLDELKHFFPAAQKAELKRSKIVTDPNSVFSVRPEVEAIRPTTTTDHAGLLLAGDWVQSGWPATMEGAVRSGRLAADHFSDAISDGTTFLSPDLTPGWLAQRLIAKSS